MGLGLVVAVNDLVEPATLAHLLAYDSVFGRFPGSIAATDGAIEIDGHRVRTRARLTAAPESGCSSPIRLCWSRGMGEAREPRAARARS